ncbi:MAG TPA: DnaJ C-terminal domain-containing protein [Bdellovibrionota bacterium]|nr:DnaJ C-terminal domain-containing protein [Bdellovibrionota bacterium]
MSPSDEPTIDVPITLADAVLGGEIRARTPDGDVMIRVPPGSNTDSRIRVAGKGVFVLKVYLPAVDSELKEAIRQWQRRHPRGSGRAA